MPPLTPPVFLFSSNGGSLFGVGTPVLLAKDNERNIIHFGVAHFETDPNKAFWVWRRPQLTSKPIVCWHLELLGLLRDLWPNLLTLKSARAQFPRAYKRALPWKGEHERTTILGSIV